MVDKIKPLKLESIATGGTQDDMFPTEVNPQEDYLATKGLAGENQDSTLFDLSASDEWQWKDTVQTTPFKLNDIVSGLANAGRWFLLHSYNGNAGVGKFLDIFPNQDSDEAPLYVPSVPLKVINIVARATALSTGTIGYYNNTTLLYTLTYTNQTEVIINGSALSPLFTVPVGGRLNMKLTSGTVQKPHIYLIGIAQ